MLALELALIALMIVTAFAPYILRYGSDNPVCIRNAFVAYYILQLGISPLFTILTGNPSELGLEPALYASDYLHALELSAAALCGFEFAHALTRSRTIALPHLLTTEWRLERVNLLLFVCLATGASAFTILLMVNGGFAQFLLDREQFRAGGMNGQGFLLFPATAIPVLGALIFVVAQGRAHAPSALRATLAMTAALIPAIFIGFRSIVLFPILQAMLVWHLCIRPIARTTAVIAAALLAVAFTIYGVYRAVPTGVPLAEAVDLGRIAIERDPRLLSGVFTRSAGTEVVAQVLHQSRPGEHVYFLPMAVEMATIAIPRTLWVTKPQPLIIRFGTRFFGSALGLARGEESETTGGISPTIVGEFFWHGGAVATIVALMVFGTAIRLIDETFRRQGRWLGAQLVYVLLFQLIVLMAEAVQGNLNGMMLYFLAVVPLLLSITSTFPNVFQMQSDLSRKITTSSRS